MPVFPTALSSLAINKSDATTAAGDHAAHHNAMADEINAIEAELGVNPSGSFTTAAARFGATSTVRKTADLANATTALANVTEMAFPVTVGADHWFDFYLPYTSSLATAGLALAVTCPASTYISYEVVIGGITADAAGATSGGHFRGQGTASGDLVSATGVAVINTVYMARVYGVCSNPGAVGNIQLQHAAEVAATLTIKKGAWGTMYLN